MTKCGFNFSQYLYNNYFSIFLQLLYIELLGLVFIIILSSTSYYMFHLLVGIQAFHHH